MLDPIVNFFTWVFQWIGRGIGLVIGIILWPFLWVGRWYAQRGWILKAVLGVVLVGLIGLYAYFFWTTQCWTNFNPNYADAYKFDEPQPACRDRRAAVRRRAGTEGDGQDVQAAPAIVDVTADLIDFNVNQNAWVSSMILYKLGLFGMPWDNTPFFDNKASFQRGINQAVRRTAMELVDKLGRVRGTAQIDPDLQERAAICSSTKSTWYFGLQPVRPEDADAQLLPRRRSAICAPSTTGCRPARRCSTRAPTICCSSSTASPATSARPRPSSRSAPRTTMTAGSTRAPTTASGSPTASSMATTAS